MKFAQQHNHQLGGCTEYAIVQRMGKDRNHYGAAEELVRMTVELGEMRSRKNHITKRIYGWPSKRMASTSYINNYIANVRASPGTEDIDVVAEAGNTGEFFTRLTECPVGPAFWG